MSENEPPQKVFAYTPPGTGCSSGALVIFEFILISFLVGGIIGALLHPVFGILAGVLTFLGLLALNRVLIFRLAISVTWGLIGGYWGVVHDPLWGIFGAVVGFGGSWLLHKGATARL